MLPEKDETGANMFLMKLEVGFISCEIYNI